MRLRLLVLTALAALVLLPAAGGADAPVLTGDVGLNDAFSISLNDSAGNRVTHLDPGTYTLVVHDHSQIHDFDLFGPGVSVTTTVEGTGDSTFTITLVDGTYRYVCDPHSSSMRGSFTVGTPPPPPPPPPPTVARLAASVGPGAHIALRGTSGLSAGRAAVVVKDASAVDNFRLSGPGLNRATGVPFRGSVTWQVTLRAGLYAFRSDRHRSLHGSFRVAG